MRAEPQSRAGWPKANHKIILARGGTFYRPPLGQFSGVKKVGFPELKILTMVIQELRSYSLVLVERVFCKVISEIKNGMATDLSIE